MDGIEADLQALPSGPQGVLPVSGWKDPARALNSVASGIRRAALDVIIESAGTFDFVAHEFSEAELVTLDEGPRTLPARPRISSELFVRTSCTNRGEFPPRRA